MKLHHPTRHELAAWARLLGFGFGGLAIVLVAGPVADLIGGILGLILGFICIIVGLIVVQMAE